MNGVYGPKEFNYFNVSREVKRLANALTAKLDHKVVLITKLSNMQGDHYLYRVMAKQNKGRETYSVWTLNTSPGIEGLNNGHYDLDFKTAYQVFGNGLKYFEN